MGEGQTGRHEGSGTGARRSPRIKPAALLGDPEARPEEVERFFDLESIEDPRELLERSTALIEAFRAAADRATEFQAMAAARMADARATPEQIADRAGWAPEYAIRMIDYGRLVEGGEGSPANPFLI